MGQINLTMPDDLRQWAESRVGSQGFASVDEYFAKLAAEDREEIRKREWLQAAIQDGRDSGVDPRSVQQIFAELFAKHNLPNA